MFKTQKPHKVVLPFKSRRQELAEEERKRNQFFVNRALDAAEGFSWSKSNNRPRSLAQRYVAIPLHKKVAAVASLLLAAIIIYSFLKISRADIERLQAAQWADAPALAQRLDALARRVDQWPLLNQPLPAAALAPGPATLLLAAPARVQLVNPLVPEGRAVGRQPLVPAYPINRFFLFCELATLRGEGGCGGSCCATLLLRPGDAGARLC